MVITLITMVTEINMVVFKVNTMGIKNKYGGN